MNMKKMLMMPSASQPVSETIIVLLTILIMTMVRSESASIDNSTDNSTETNTDNSIDNRADNNTDNIVQTIVLIDQSASLYYSCCSSYCPSLPGNAGAMTAVINIRRHVGPSFPVCCHGSAPWAWMGPPLQAQPAPLARRRQRRCTALADGHTQTPAVLPPFMRMSCTKDQQVVRDRRIVEAYTALDSASVLGVAALGRATGTRGDGSRESGPR